MFFLLKYLQENKKSAFLIVSLALLPLLTSSFFIFYSTQNEILLRNLVIYQKIIFFLISIFTMAFALTPTTLIALMSGFLWGFEAIFGLIISYGMAAIVGYFSGKKIDNGHLNDFFSKNEKLTSLQSKIEEKSVIIILLMRISPVLPFAITNIFLAMLKVKFSKYLIMSILGMLPRTTLAIWLGTQSSTLKTAYQSGNLGISQVFVIGLVLISIVGLSIVGKQIQKSITN